MVENLQEKLIKRRSQVFHNRKNMQLIGVY